MIRSKIKIIFLTLSVLVAANVWSQSCDSLMSICKNYLAKPSKKDPKWSFISDGQTYRAFLDEGQTAEFTTTFYGGSAYRLAVSAGTKDNYLIFDIYDSENNLLFSNLDYKLDNKNNTPYWDFVVENTLDLRIELRLDETKKTSGCAVLLIGFKQIRKK